MASYFYIHDHLSKTLWSLETKLILYKASLMSILLPGFLSCPLGESFALSLRFVVRIIYSRSHVPKVLSTLNLACRVLRVRLVRLCTCLYP